MSLATKRDFPDTVLGNADRWLVTLRRNWDSGDTRVAVPPQVTEGRELGPCRLYFVVQMVSMRAVVLTGHQTQRCCSFERVRESERRGNCSVYSLARGAAYLQGPPLVFGG